MQVFSNRDDLTHDRSHSASFPLLTAEPRTNLGRQANSKHKPQCRRSSARSKKRRYAHEFKKAIEEFEKLYRFQESSKGPLANPPAISNSGSNGEVTDIDPGSADRPSLDQMPDTHLGFTAMDPRPSSPESPFDSTTAQRIRHQQLMDDARRNQDYHAELGILEPEENDAILNIDNWEDVMIDVTLDSGVCRNVMPCQ